MGPKAYHALRYINQMVALMLDASGILYIENNTFLVAEDETDILRYFYLDTEKHTFTATQQTIILGENESDFESLAYDTEIQRYFCIGSHGAEYSKRLVSFQTGSEGQATDVYEIDFDAKHLVSGKIDIEALTVWNAQLLIGYRKPHDRKKALAILFDPENNTQLLCKFDLAGRTFRDMVRIADKSYLILAGPEKGKEDNKYPSCIFWWNGDIFKPGLKLCEIDLSGYCAEGIAVRVQSDNSLDILIGSDESKTKSAKVFRMLCLSVSGIDELFNVAKKPVELTVSLF